MNDLELVRELRAEVPSPELVRLASGRARLLASISRPSRPGGLRRAILPVGAVTAAAAIAGAAVFGSGTGSPGRSANGSAGRSATGRTAPATQLTLTARLLNTASETVAKQPAVSPGPHQWFYTKNVQYSYGQPIQSNENWTTFDGRQTAYYQNGHLIVHTAPGVFGGGGPTPFGQYNDHATPLTAYNALASLPSSPEALLAVVAHQVAELGPNGTAGDFPTLYAPTTRSELEFDYLAQLMSNAVTGEPRSAEAAVFRAMAAIPGVSSQQGITDVLGQPVIGLSADGGQDQLLLDPSSYQVVGMREISTGNNPVRVKGPAGPWPAKGGVVASSAWAEVAMVSGPGRS